MDQTKKLPGALEPSEFDFGYNLRNPNRKRCVWYIILHAANWDCTIWLKNSVKCMDADEIHRIFDEGMVEIAKFDCPVDEFISRLRFVTGFQLWGVLTAFDLQ